MNELQTQREHNEMILFLEIYISVQETEY